MKSRKRYAKSVKSDAGQVLEVEEDDYDLNTSSQKNDKK